MSVEKIIEWCDIKGVDIISTGDCLQEFWLAEILKWIEFPPSKLGRVKAQSAGVKYPLFCLGTEVALEFNLSDMAKRIHVLMLFPDLEVLEMTRNNMVAAGHNLYDGRPTLFGVGLHELLELSERQAVIIPAHFWTPWFGMMGARSGFSSFAQLEYYEYEPTILETGLSSDMEMNGRIDALKDCSLVSFSDAHSPEKIGREATIVPDVDNFDDLIDALKAKPKTLEWYPHLGKYHYTGHRFCNTRFKDDTTTCPVCFKQMTIGVHNRIYKMSDRSIGIPQQDFVYINSVKEIARVAGIKIQYPLNGVRELDLFTAPERLNGLDPTLRRYVERYMKRDIRLSGGYDGVFGKFTFKREEIYNLLPT
jgi:PHP family Zn ribbon phosphoesterase